MQVVKDTTMSVDVAPRKMTADSMQQDFERKGNYRVQIGLYRMFSNAQYALMQAISKGFNGEIVSQGEYYAVLVGNTDSYAKAQELERQLQQAGFDTLIITSR